MNCYEEENDNDKELQETFQSEVQYGSQLWNFIFGHLNFGGLKLLHMKNMVKGFPFINKPDRVCEEFIFGMQQRETFLVKKSYRACTPLEIVHSDLCPNADIIIGG